MSISKRGAALSHDEREDLVRLIDAEGVAKLSSETGLSRTAILSAAIGQPVLVGTRSVIRDLLDHGHDAEDDDESDDDLDEGDDESDDDESDDEDA